MFLSLVALCVSICKRVMSIHVGPKVTLGFLGLVCIDVSMCGSLVEVLM